MSLSLPIKSKITSENVARYVAEKIVIESVIEKNLRLETSKLPNYGMISSSDVGALLAILVQSVQASQAIEIGTFTGYTALKIAQALPANGTLVCCDINEVWTNIGRTYWNQANVNSKIDLRLAPALDTVNHLLKNGAENTFDFAFIDAAKRDMTPITKLA